MAHPSEYYIKYLIITGHTGEAGLAHINQTLDNYKCPRLKAEELAPLQEKIRPPSDLLLSNKKHKGTQEYMKEQGLDALWDPDEEVKRMLELCNQPMVLQDIQLLILGDVPMDAIAEKTSVKFAIEPQLTVRSLELYCHFFWNRTRVGYDEWENYLWKMRGRDHYLAALYCSRDQALWRCGYNPKIEGKSSLRDAHRNIHFRLEATRHMPDSKETAEIITKYTKELASIHNVLYSEGAALEEVIREFRAIKMETQPAGVKSIADIAGDGSYSNNESNPSE